MAQSHPRPAQLHGAGAAIDAAPFNTVVNSDPVGTVTRFHASAALLFAFVALHGWGCSVKPWIHVFNNSRESIVIHVDEKEHVAQPAKQVSFLYENDALTVQIGSCSVLYRMASLPPEYIRTGWFRGHITFQMDSDRRAFVLKAHDEAPILAASYPQPEGYPLDPILNEACDG